MAYNHDRSMAYIDNVLEALNCGGMLTCDDLMRRIWDNATVRQVVSKTIAPRNADLHTEDYARQQVKQEIRRSLHNYFRNPNREYVVHRATAFGDCERFWVTVPQEEVEPAPRESADEEPAFRELTCGESVSESVDRINLRIQDIISKFGVSA